MIETRLNNSNSVQRGGDGEVQRRSREVKMKILLFCAEPQETLSPVVAPME